MTIDCYDSMVSLVTCVPQPRLQLKTKQKIERKKVNGNVFNAHGANENVKLKPNNTIICFVFVDWIHMCQLHPPTSTPTTPTHGDVSHCDFHMNRVCRATCIATTHSHKTMLHSFTPPLSLSPSSFLALPLPLPQYYTSRDSAKCFIFDSLFSRSNLPCTKAVQSIAPPDVRWNHSHVRPTEYLTERKEKKK